MVSITSLEDRRMRFEARCFAIESFLKVHLEHAEGARLLLMNHLRLMFTLSLGALAAVVTLYGAVLRFGLEPAAFPLRDQAIAVAIAALTALVASALLSARSLQRTASKAALLLHEPFPGSEADLERIMSDSDIDETEILTHFVRTITARIEAEPVTRISMTLNVVLLVGGVGLAGSAFFI
jgi:hypothetical protein